MQFCYLKEMWVSTSDNFDPYCIADTIIDYFDEEDWEECLGKDYTAKDIVESIFGETSWVRSILENLDADEDLLNNFDESTIAEQIKEVCYSLLVDKYEAIINDI